VELIADVITISAAPATKTTKIQFHEKIVCGDKGIYLWVVNNLPHADNKYLYS
jgi:hypothetical protein